MTWLGKLQKVNHTISSLLNDECMHTHTMYANDTWATLRHENHPITEQHVPLLIPSTCITSVERERERERGQKMRRQVIKSNDELLIYFSAASALCCVHRAAKHKKQTSS